MSLWFAFKLSTIHTLSYEQFLLLIIKSATYLNPRYVLFNQTHALWNVLQFGKILKVCPVASWLHLRLQVIHGYHCSAKHSNYLIYLVWEHWNGWSIYHSSIGYLELANFGAFTCFPRMAYYPLRYMQWVEYEFLWSCSIQKKFSITCKLD